MADTDVPRRALLGTIVFTLTIPGTAIVLVPWLVTGWRLAPPLFGIEATRSFGGALIVLAAPLFFRFLSGFVREGHGTPAPIAPTEHLVVGGPFRWVRNPGYVAVVSLVVGQALLFGSRVLLAYAAALFAAFHLFVVFYEEPTLRRQFGEEYDAYYRQVPRWLPRRQQSRWVRGERA
jgi:protein-S-isoprenylcysteine O-methyltransferase Ste14